MDQAKLIAYALNLRNIHQADVIFFFTTTMFDQNGSGICGWAPQRNWTDGGGTPAVFDDPDGDGIDLTGREELVRRDNGHHRCLHCRFRAVSP